MNMIFLQDATLHHLLQEAYYDFESDEPACVETVAYGVRLRSGNKWLQLSWHDIAALVHRFGETS